METVIRRYKTLGAWVPRWVAGPCRNRECEAYVPEDAADSEGPEDPENQKAAELPGGSGTGGT